MPVSTPLLFGFNRGRIGKSGLARTDLTRTALSAEIMTNWSPRSLGSMMLRPGTGYIGATDGHNEAILVDFVFSLTDLAILEFTNNKFRVWVDDALISRGDVDSAVTNGTFDQYTNTCTISNASPGVVTYTGADNFANDDPVTFSTTGALPSPLVAGTTYYVINVSTGANTFQVAETAGGSAINTTDAGSGAHTVEAYNFITGWTDSDDSATTSVWSTGDNLSLTGTGFASARRRQEVTVASGDQNDPHALRIVISRGKVQLKVGSSAGGEQYISETTLGVGTHSIAFTPTGNFFIELAALTQYASIVDSISVEATGVLELPTVYETADLENIRYDQSGDVVYLCDGTNKQYKVERRSNDSWSIVEYDPVDGPFRIENTGPKSISVDAITGDVTLTATGPIFRSGHDGALFKLTSTGQLVEATFTGEDQFSDYIRVTGVGSQRIFQYILTDLTSTSTEVTLQRSITEPGAWVDVTSHTTDGTRTFDDNLDNQIAYYRLGVKTGDYSSGTVLLELTYSKSGSITGIVKITNVASATSASAIVLKSLGGTTGSTIWSEGAWSDTRGWPSAVSFYEGRLWWAGKDNIWGSVSDGFESFDSTIEGDAKSISRSIGFGPVDTINWLLPIQNMIMGGQGDVFRVFSTTFDEPLTATNFQVKSASNQGSARVDVVRMDSSGIFVQRSGSRVYRIFWSFEDNTHDVNELTMHVPEIGEPSITRMAIQRQPETRIHCLRSDGTVAILMFDKGENITCWYDFETDGLVEDIITLPGEIEDQVYYVIRRVIDGGDTRYIEKLAFESDCIGGSITKLMDSHIVYQGTTTATITGLDHLEGENVVVWGNSMDMGSYTVSSGAITLSAEVSNAVIGLPYEAQWKSTKLAYAAYEGNTPLLQKKKVNSVGFVLRHTHSDGITYGPDFTTQYDLPSYERGTLVSENSTWEDYDNELIEFPGQWDTDSRICLVAASPKPANVLAISLGIETHGKF